MIVMVGYNSMIVSLYRVALILSVASSSLLLSEGSPFRGPAVHGSTSPGKKITGHYSWVDATGRSHMITYVTDEFGNSRNTQTLGDRNIDDATPILHQSNTLAVRKEQNNIFSNKISNKNKSTLSVKSITAQSEHTARKQPNSAKSVETLVDTIMREENPGLNGEPKTAKMISSDMAANIQDLFSTQLPSHITGTNFVLIGRLQPPTIPKMKTPPSMIVPVKLDRSEPIATSISGIHSSSRAKSLTMNLVNKGRSFGGKVQSVPQPSKVEGNLNLDNFFSPIIQPTPGPFVLESYNDYFYGDYDYYDDYADTNGTAAATNITTESNSQQNITAESAQHQISKIDIEQTTTSSVFLAPTSNNKPTNVVPINRPPSLPPVNVIHQQKTTHELDENSGSSEHQTSLEYQNSLEEELNSDEEEEDDED